MAPRKTNKKAEVEKAIDYSSPASKRKLTMNRKDTFRRGMNLIQMINGEAKERQGKEKEKWEILAAERVAVDNTRPVKFEAFKKEHDEHLRKQPGGTGLTKAEWESVTAYDVLRMLSIADKKTQDWVGPIMKKATAFERYRFNILLHDVDLNIQRAAKFHRAMKKAAKAEAKAEMENAMRPEF